MMKKEDGITLIALIIAIIIMLILAGVAISALIGDNGIFTKAESAAGKYNNAALNEAELLNQIIGIDEIPTKIPDLNEANLQFTYTPSEWTNKEVNVNISTTLKYYTIQYSLDNGTTWSNYKESTIKIDKNKTTILARLEKNGVISNIVAATIQNIDNVSPKSCSVLSSNIQETAFTMIANSEDEEETATSAKSGIGKYEFYVEGQLYKTINIEEGTSVEVKDRVIDTTYNNCYVISYDRAGNYKESQHINIKTKSAGIPATDPGIKGGQYVQYSAGSYDQWRVLTNNGTTVTLISVGCPKTQYLYGRDARYNGVTYLNNACQQYIDTNYVASVRNADKNDVNTINTIGALATGMDYWLATPYDSYGPDGLIWDCGMEWVNSTGAVSVNAMIRRNRAFLIYWCKGRRQLWSHTWNKANINIKTWCEDN